MDQSNILNAAKKAKSIEELKQIAVDNGITLTDEKAKFYFSMLDEKEGELSLDELGAATGGNTTNGKFKQAVPACSSWKCRCGTTLTHNVYFCEKCGTPVACSKCLYLAQAEAAGICMQHPDNLPGGC